MKNQLIIPLILLLIVTIKVQSQCSGNVNFVDPNFKESLYPVDTNSDGEISCAEAAAFTGSLWVFDSDHKIYDLTGIEAFINITGLNCINNDLSTLDVSKNTKLETLYFSNNKIKNIDLSKNLALKNLSINNNPITSIDVSKNKELFLFDGDNTQIETLDFSKNNKLKAVDFGYNNKLTSVNLKNGANTSIWLLTGNNNPLLTCIEVDDATYAPSGWNVDDPSVFSEDCFPAAAKVTDQVLASGVALYPNPATDQVTFNWDKLAPLQKVTVHSINGSIMKTFDLSGMHSSTTLSLQELPNGIYMMKVQDRNGVTITKKLQIN